ncbi:hypothetical protein EDB85DRAFT_2152955 [Lactarius pseudohatsudake]|nr:hypothetical protein EDB85DRAFT_2152955 [Lactarius pseudohatsudake]
MARAAPLAVTVVCLLLANQHLSPVDDCPCFEDAIAFASVIHHHRLLVLEARPRAEYRPVHLGPVLDSPAAITAWVLFALLKPMTGVLIIFSWRILAKPSVQTLLPPLFRWLPWESPVRLPHRWHYTPATEYVHGPPHTLQAVPSMINLDLAVAEVANEDAGVQEKAVVFEEASEGGTGEDGKASCVAIGAIATVMVPALFEALEWGVEYFCFV